jgi:asparagine synthetase B (glutamine-hydrolysing)
MEVDTRGVYCVTLGHVLQLSLAPWSSAVKSWERDQSLNQSRDNPQQELFRLLSDAVRRRVRVSTVPRDTVPVLVMYSGGLDSTVLAALVDLHLPPECPIDLVNVAFPSTPRATKGPPGQLISFDTAPDRLAAVTSLADLRAVSPRREWRLIFADISAEELQQQREHVVQLMYPAHTVMDLSIAASLWFAARGEGYIYRTEQPSDRSAVYRSSARIVLSGLGADECLGGYSRHRAAALRGVLDLTRELERDVTRLWYRNCGRDDRLISDHARELRIPFLDERVISFLTALPVQDRMNLNEVAGVGDKKLLRQLALSLGLKHAATLAKRAIQFGSNIARLNKEQKGTNKRAIKGQDKIQ